MTNGDVDTVQLLLLIIGLVEALLVDDCIDGDSGFTLNQAQARFKARLRKSTTQKADKSSRLPGLSVTNDELSLASTDWHQAVYGLDTGLHRLAY